MTIAPLIEQQGISEVLHFTMGDNFVEILSHGAVISRILLEQERAKFQSLERIGDTAWPDRLRDLEWWGYINLSIETVNQYLLNRAKINHPGQRWFVLSFDPHILTHEDVYFTTTNNAYEPHVLRGKGPDGLKLPYSTSYKDRNGNVHRRQGALPKQIPTSQQAEVLYPNELSLNHLRAIYVEDDEGFLHASQAVHSQKYISGVKHEISLTPEIAPEKFLAHSKQECY